MPLIFFLAVPGSPYRLSRRVTRLIPRLHAAPATTSQPTRCLATATTTRCRAPSGSVPLLFTRPARSTTYRSIYTARHESLLPRSRYYSAQPSEAVAKHRSSSDAQDTLHNEHSPTDLTEESRRHHRKQVARRARKAQRLSRPSTILKALGHRGREIYTIAPPGKKDLSYTNPRRTTSSRASQCKPSALPVRTDTTTRPEPVTFYLILARYLEHHVSMPPSDFEHTPQELDFLRAQACTPATIATWCSSLAETKSGVAAEIFESDRGMPPLFLLLLYLRRRNIRISALGVVMRHLHRRQQKQDINWAALKLIVVRLLRHARKLWPESIPWIASMFTTEATRLHTDRGSCRPVSTKVLAEISHFCNAFLLLLSLPASRFPVLSASHQEKAQFQILHYMANSSPAIVVTKLGFRSVIRTQLAHPKTAQEREWAELKGPSWPPWKEDRTAMDEDKGYEFGASRASQILHRMYEAGYSGQVWEDVAQIYAGWDIDSSPTIQSRTSLPHFSSQFKDKKALRPILWAARIQTTRTRREAWAAFLSCETSGEATHQEIYLAIFEKIYRDSAERSVQRDFNAEPTADLDRTMIDMLPGDMKEVLPEPVSPLHNIYISEPVPNYRELFHRMHATQLRPSSRLLAFLLESTPDFDMGLIILSIASDNAIDRLAAGLHDTRGPISTMPHYLFTAFIRFLCRFGRYTQPPLTTPTFKAPEQHADSLKHDRHYLLEYAHALLAYYRPQYMPAWMVFADKLVRHKSGQLGGSDVRYRIICDLVDKMGQADLDIDDEMFRIMCTACSYAAQSADQGTVQIEDARHVFSTESSSRLRRLFHGIVGRAEVRNSASQLQQEKIIPPPIPDAGVLHAYVRVLGILQDYEGLYSFSTWLAAHHAEVKARAEARVSGSRLLFRTLVALRAAVDGSGPQKRAPADIAQLIRAQIESVEEWGGWPDQEYVDMYRKGHLTSPMPVVGGR